MKPIHYYLSSGIIIIVVLAAVLLLLKVILYFKYEKHWDPIGFFHYSKVNLRMTTSKSLREWRKRQNTMTSMVSVLLLLLIVILLFNKMIGA